MCVSGCRTTGGTTSESSVRHWAKPAAAAGHSRQVAIEGARTRHDQRTSESGSERPGLWDNRLTCTVVRCASCDGPRTRDTREIVRGGRDPTRVRDSSASPRLPAPYPSEQRQPEVKIDRLRCAASARCCSPESNSWNRQLL